MFARFHPRADFFGKESRYLIQINGYGCAGPSNGWSDLDLSDGFRLTGLFLLRHVLEPR